MINKFLSRHIHEPVTWLTLATVLVSVPHLARLPLWSLPVLAAFSVWRLAGIRKPKLLPGKFLLFIIAIVLGLGVLMSFGTVINKSSGVALLTIMLFTKLLECRNRRDLMILAFLCFFMVMTNFLFSQSIAMTAYMFALTIFLTACLITINQGPTPIAVTHRLRIALRIVALALPLMLTTFALFPRISGPIWSLPDDAAAATTGLSETMSPGSISRLTQSNEVAFRVKFKGAPPPQKDLYWRALVLWNFDGKTWAQGQPNPTSHPVLEVEGTTTEYTVTMAAHNQKWLFALDMPSDSPASSNIDGDFVLRTDSRINALNQYTLKSYTQYRIGRQVNDWEVNTGLKLPHSLNPKTIALAQSWKTQWQTPEAIVKQALKYFNKEPFSYSLEPPLTPGPHALDQFLFSTRIGFCGHYSSAFAVLMRAAGIPARVVIGYQGGEINPLNDYLVVRQSHAHAWTEIWLPDKGWSRIDPTAVIAPERIEQSLDAALPRHEHRPSHILSETGWIKQIKLLLDAVDNSWDQWIVGYTPELQTELLSKLFQKNISIQHMMYALVASLAVILALVTLLFWKQRPSAKPLDQAQKLYATFCRKLGAAGLTRKHHEGPLEFSRRVIESRPDLKPQVAKISGLYAHLRYRNMEDSEKLARLRRLIRQFKAKKQKRMK